MFVFSAAGFIATSTSGRSPGVRMSWSAKCSWKPDTPGSEPAGARISAGKSGNVERSLPDSAVSEVKRPPVSCIPSPESPAKRMTTESSCSTGFATAVWKVAPEAARALRVFPQVRGPGEAREAAVAASRARSVRTPGLRRDELLLGAQPVLEGIASLLEMNVVRTRRDVLPAQDDRLRRLLLRAARAGSLRGCRLLRRGGLGGLSGHSRTSFGRQGVPF